jgi:hypothetical protein
METAPASTIKSAHTVAKMGLRIKNSTKNLTLPYLVCEKLQPINARHAQAPAAA